MRRTKIDETAGDLFSAAAGAEASEQTVLIASPLVAETAGWLENRAKTLGSMQCSLLHELRRRLRTVDGEAVSYETAGDVLYRVEQMHAYVEATAKTLQALNLRLLGFGVETFDADEAKTIVSELGVFLDRFGRRFGPLREEIAADLAELSKPTQERLADATGFYAPDGKAVRLGDGRYTSFVDCRGIVDVIMATRLGGGQKAKRHLEIVGTPCAEARQVAVAEGELSFQDLELAESNGTGKGDD